MKVLVNHCILDILAAPDQEASGRFLVPLPGGKKKPHGNANFEPSEVAPAGRGDVDDDVCVRRGGPVEDQDGAGVGGDGVRL